MSHKKQAGILYRAPVDIALQNRGGAKPKVFAERFSCVTLAQTSVK